MDFLDSVMQPLYIAVSAIMVAFHALFTRLGLGSDSGVTWALSIIGLVVVIRTLLIPLFVKQIRSQRGLQLLQPEIKKLQEKYKNDREKQTQELMKLYKETRTNPLSSCLPLLAQAPVFFALFGVLNGIPNNLTRGVLTPELVASAKNADFFGAKLFETFLGSTNGTTKAVAALLIVGMSASTFITQKQLMTKNMPASAMDSPFAQQQKILLYVFPLIFAVSGINFPIGVLLYWCTTNVWSMGQQLYVIARSPAPGSVAEEALNRKRAAKQLGGGGATALPDAVPAPAAPARPVGQRQQPRRNSKRRR